MAASQLVQYEGLKYAVEANRRRAMHSSGTFPWQFNEPYPNNTCVCRVDYGLPKPAFYGVARAYEFFAVSVEFDGKTLAGKSGFYAKIWFQTSALSARAHIIARLVDFYGKNVVSCEFSVSSGGERAAFAGEFSCDMTKVEMDIFFLLLEGEADGIPLRENRYLFTRSTLAPLLSQERPSISMTIAKDEKAKTWVVSLTNRGRQATVGIKLEDSHDPDGKTFCYLTITIFICCPVSKNV